MRRLTLAVLSLVLLAACQPGVAPLTDEDLAALEDLRAANIQATLAGDCDALNAMFAEDAVLLPQDEPMIEGAEAIRATCDPDEATPQEVTITSLGIDGYGDLAVGHGTWSQTFLSEDEAEPLTISGKYVLVSRKQADGSWLWSVLIWNSDAPLPQPEPEET
jgi:ketosteroid isomerase-like protein